MPLQETSGAASYDAFGGGVPVVPTYIEDVFSTWLYTGTGNTLTVTNGIDLSGKGGLVWAKDRTFSGENNRLYDTARGVNKVLFSNATNASSTVGDLSSFNSNGFTVASDATSNINYAPNNPSPHNYVTWTFREQAKFFDVVTYTGNGVAGRTVSHNLGAVPGCIIVKRTDAAEDWGVYHTALGNTKAIFLNFTSAADTNVLYWNNTSPTSTQFSVGSWAGVNANGGTYVAYLFAHDAGGFGLTGTDNVISCGSYIGDGAATKNISIGYEPQWVLVKNASDLTNWLIIDQMRGMPTGVDDSRLLNPNLANAESINNRVNTLSATGFLVQGAAAETNQENKTYIYIAIRRGPMKVPTTGTSVLGLNARSGNNTNTTVTGGAGVTDAALIKNRGSSQSDLFTARLTNTGYLVTSGTGQENVATSAVLQSNPWDVMDGIKVGTTSNITNANGQTFINYLFRRAPGFFDVVCYTGTGATTTFNHSLTVAPELMIVKIRNQPGAAWAVYNAASGATRVIRLNTTAAQTTSAAYWNNTAPTASVFTVGNDGDVNNAGDTYINYMFATCPGVSKVGGYTGTGTTLQIDCGFTTGARFVLIRRTDSTGDWYLWDSARGIVAGNDPYWLVNSIAAEVTTTDYIDTLSSGFEISSTAPAAINANGGSFIFLAIA